MKKLIYFILLALALSIFSSCYPSSGDVGSTDDSAADDGQSSDVSDTFVENESIALINAALTEEVDRTLPCTNLFSKMPYTMSRNPDSGYTDSGNKLTDGVTSELFDRNLWLGFSGYSSFYIDFDLGADHSSPIADISVGCLRQLDYAIGLPRHVAVSVSYDGKTYIEVAKLFTPGDLGDSDKYVYEFCLPQATTARFIRIDFGRSEESFHFIDEISAYCYSEDGEGYRDVAPEDNPGADIYNYALDLSDSVPYPGVEDSDYTTYQNLARLDGVDVQIEQFYDIIKDAVSANTAAEKKNILIDGKKVSASDFSDPALFRFMRGYGRHVVLDLKYLMSVSEWSCQLIANQSAGLGCPMEMVVSLREDGVSWTTVAAQHSEGRGANGNEIVELGSTLDKSYRARYVRFSFVVDNGQYNATEHYVSVFISELEVYGTKSAENAADIAHYDGNAGKYAAPEQLDGIKNLLFAGVGSLDTDAFTYDSVLDIFAMRDENGTITGELMDAVCMARSTTLGFSFDTAANYESYFDIIFDADKNLGALDSAYAEIRAALGNDRLPVYLSIFTPTMGNTVFGEINGESVDFSTNENRLKIVRYLIDRYIALFNEQGYENLYLAGFYWECESISVETPAQDIELVRAFNDYAHTLNYKTFWVPYFCANYYYYWEQLGFDLACLQPNYSFTTDSEKILDAAAYLAWIHGMSVEMEIEDYKSAAGSGKYKQYLEAGVRLGYVNSVNIYYQGGIPGAIISSKDYNGDEFSVYADTCLYISGNMPQDYYDRDSIGLDGIADAITLETTDGTAVSFTIEGAEKLQTDIALLPKYGALLLNRDGSGQYTPLKAYVGEVSFAIRVTDTNGESKIVNLTVTITQ